MRITILYGYLQLLYKNAAARLPAATLLKRINYLIDVFSTVSMTRARSYTSRMLSCTYVCAWDAGVRMRGLCTSHRCSNIIIFIYATRAYTLVSVNLYLFSRIVSQVLFIRHRSHFLPGTAFRGLRRLLHAAINAPPSTRRVRL